jgi:hypothetical protein
LFHLFQHLPLTISEVFSVVWEIIPFFWHMKLRHRVMGSGHCQELTVPWRWRHCVPSKRRDPIRPWRDVTS